jgi:hypothetical protein
LIDVQRGDCLGEDDIVRLEDDFGRAGSAVGERRVPNGADGALDQRRADRGGRRNARLRPDLQRGLIHQNGFFHGVASADEICHRGHHFDTTTEKMGP